MNKHLYVAALLMMSLSACSAGASLVRKDSSGGRVVLEGAYMRAMGDARMLMVEHCGGRVDAVELGNSLEFRCRRARPGQAGPVKLAAGQPMREPGL